MSNFGRHWALKIRGCTIGEHAYLYRLGDRHNEKTGLCYPGKRSLSFELECSEVYLKQMAQSLELKKFLVRNPRFDFLGKQTTNQFLLNFDRWFPFYSEDVEREEKHLLAFFRHAVESPELAQGFHSVWLEKPYVPKTGKSQTGKKPRNDFRKEGYTLRKTQKRPVSTVLWLAVMSEGHERHLIYHLPQIMKEIKKDTQHDFDFKPLRIWLKKPHSTDFD